MTMFGATGFNKDLFNWSLWPRDGLLQLHDRARTEDAISVESTEYTIKYTIQRHPTDADYPYDDIDSSYSESIFFYGSDLEFDEKGALVGGVIETIYLYSNDPKRQPLREPLLEITKLRLNVEDFNADPSFFMDTFFSGNNDVYFSHSTIEETILLGDGDDGVTIVGVYDKGAKSDVVDLGAGDDWIAFGPATCEADLLPKSLILGEGFDDVAVSVGDYLGTSSIIEDFDPNEDRIHFRRLDPDTKLADNGGEGVTVANFHIKGITEDQVKLENGYLIGINGRDYEAYHDIYYETEHLHGETGRDVFVLEHKRDDYRWHATDDGKGIVIWHAEKETPDLLYDFDVLRFDDVSVNLADWPEFNGPDQDGIRDVADQTQYLRAEEWGETFIIDGKMSDYQWAPTQDRTGTVVWNVKTGKHDILTDFAWINFNDSKADLVQYPRSNAPTTEDQVDTDEIVKADNHREVFEIDGYRDDYSWRPNPDGEGIAIWNGTNIDILIGFDGVRFLDSYADLRALPQWGDVPRPNGEILIKDDPTDNQYLRGETGEEIFVFDGNKGDYNWGPTRDGKGVVVWNKDGFDILMDFKAIRFNDDTITTNEIRGIADGNVSGVKIKDITNETQYLHGEGDKDQFIIDGDAEDYAWGATRDETGFVVWNRETKIHDILTDFEEVVFNDQVLVIDDVI